MKTGWLSAPVPLGPEHEATEFQSGEQALDLWLKERAVRNEKSGASRTYVVCEGSRVVAYYCLAAGAIAHEAAPKAIRRNMPNPIPVIVLGRLAVDVKFQNAGLGKALLLDATRRALQASRISGVVALLVHAISEPARQFYVSRGFIESPTHPMTLMLMLGTAVQVLE